MSQNRTTMRDALISEIHRLMPSNKDIIFLSADLGAPSLDKIRSDFPDRFINVGIAEQNLINVATGLALEGFVVYAYAIAPFLCMRAYEQIRINLALLSQHRQMNVNLIGVGSGVSYDVAGPTHQCFEDITIMRALPNIEFFSPCDWYITQNFVEYSIKSKKPKYLRLDGKILPNIYDSPECISWSKGFCELIEGKDICIVSTGYFTHRAIAVANKILKENGIKIGVIDLYMLKPVGERALIDTLLKYHSVITIEEGFVEKGGIDSLVLNLINKNANHISVDSIGFKDTYVFASGTRDYIGALNNCSDDDLIAVIQKRLSANQI
jgi:transketolase